MTEMDGGTDAASASSGPAQGGTGTVWTVVGGGALTTAESQAPMLVPPFPSALCPALHAATALGLKFQGAD
jgi:hypothetical protein